MKSLFIIESPLQLLNAYEAIHYFETKKFKILIRLSGDKSNDRQIFNLLSFLKLKHSSWIVKIKAKNKTFFDYLKIIIIKMITKVIYKKYAKIFIGNYESGFINTITKFIDQSHIILLDDGAKSIVIQSKFHGNYNRDFFSFYDLTPYENQTIYKNDFLKTKEKTASLKTLNSILFLGSKLSEINITSEEYYIKLIDKISKYFNDDPIVYIPHREEKPEKLYKLIKLLPNLTVHSLDYPVELYGLYEAYPSKIVSFYSTALFTMSKIYDCESYAFKFDYSNYLNKKNIDKVYEYYKKEMKVVDIK